MPFGPVASDPTVSRLITVLAADVGPVLAAVNTARAAARVAKHFDQDALNKLTIMRGFALEYLILYAFYPRRHDFGLFRGGRDRLCG